MINEEQITLASQADEETAMELIKLGEWGVWFEICHTLQQMAKKGYQCTLDNLKFFFALHKYEIDNKFERTQSFWVARKMFV